MQSRRPTVTFRDLPASAGVASQALQSGQKLQADYRASSCDITVARALGDSAGELKFLVSIHLHVPGALIRAQSEPRTAPGQADAYAALRLAFQDATRQLRKLRVKRYDSYDGSASD